MSRASVGFWLFRTKREDSTYHPRWRFRYLGADGKLKVATGFTDKGETRRLAQQLALEADEIRRGVRKPPQLADSESLKPIGEHVEAYMTWGRTQGGRGGRPWSKMYQQKQETVLGWWIEALKLRTLQDVALPSVEEALQGKAKGGATGKTLFNVSATLKAFVHWCLQRKYLSSDPLDGLRKFDTSVSAKNYRRAFTLEEVGKLLGVAVEPFKLIYRLALVTGFRAGEIKSLRVGDLDEERRTILLRAEYAKNRKEASCALPEDLALSLVRRVEGRAQELELFPDWDYNHAADQISLDMKRAGIEKRNFHGKADFHSLRTTHINLGIELGFDVKTAQTLARHESPELTMNTYGRANAERLRAAVVALGEALNAAESKNSRKVVEREALPLAAGAEGFSHPPSFQGDGAILEMVGARGIEPPLS